LAGVILITAAVFVFLGAGDAGTRFNEIGHRMMCICGCNQILLECNHVGCPASDGMRNELMAALTRGDSDSLVEQSFVQKYGPTVLAAPTGKGFDRAAYIMPFVALVLGFGLIVIASGRTVRLPPSPMDCVRCAVWSWKNSAIRRERIRIYELDCNLSGHGSRSAFLRLLPAGKAFSWPGENADGIFA
jgi:cytochrome c-type biogenesis protein CcmH